MTILGPILTAAIGIVPIWLKMQNKEKQKVEVIDESMLFIYPAKDGTTKGLIPENKTVHFDYPPISLQQARNGFYDTDYDAILYIPKVLLNGGQKGINLFYKEKLSQDASDYIQGTLSNMIFNTMLATNKVNPAFIKDAKDKSTFEMFTTQLNKDGSDKKTNTDLNEGIGLACAFMIYFFIFLYGVQVMRGVMEEKTNRIVEIILSSVKPFQLMMGKIVGIALVGLTQFLLWVLLTVTLYFTATVTILKDVDMNQVQQKNQTITIGAQLNVSQMKENKRPDEVTKLWNEFKSVDVVGILWSFLFYFLGGYLLYAALFAAVGAAIDSEADTQQFMLPITIPLVLAMVVARTVIQDPQGPVAFWFSMIPFTSPVVMMIRLPWGVPLWQLALSMTLLVGGFLLTTWIAGRIYRTGILMYGKKVTWKELGKWLFYKG